MTAMVLRKRAAGRAVAVQAPRRKPKRAKGNGVSGGAHSAAAMSPYALHPGVVSLQRWIRSLAGSTGRSASQWVDHIREVGPDDERECRVWLKETYDIGGSHGLWLAAKAFNNREALAEATPAGYLALAPKFVEQMFGGGKARLAPLYVQFLAVARELGSDVQICPCKAAVSLYRRRLFARIAPQSPRRLDLGLCLGEEPHTARLLKSPAGSGSERITHFVALASVEDVDLQVKRWLKQAYDRGR
jgi:hypothetical protein